MIKKERFELLNVLKILKEFSLSIADMNTKTEDGAEKLAAAIISLEKMSDTARERQEIKMITYNALFGGNGLSKNYMTKNHEITKYKIKAKNVNDIKVSFNLTKKNAAAY